MMMISSKLYCKEVPELRSSDHCVLHQRTRSNKSKIRAILLYS